MNPHDQPQDLVPDRVEWVPASPDAIEVRVFGTWSGTTVPPRVLLIVGEDRRAASPAPPGPDVPPAWSAAFVAPAEARALAEAGSLALDVDGAVVPLPAAAPGRMEAEEPAVGGTLVDPTVLAERRARRAEIAEQSAADRAASAEHAAGTLRAQLENVEGRLSQAAAERDALAARVVDAERRLRLAEQRAEAERRRRGELEEETATSRREAEDELRLLRDRLASAEEVTEALERELAHARHRVATERAARERVDEQLREALERVQALEGSAGSEAEDLRRQAAVLADRLAEAEAERGRLEAARATVDELEAARSELAELRSRLATVSAALDAERAGRADVESRLEEERAARDLAARHAQEQGAERDRAQAEADAARAALEDAGPVGDGGARELALAEQVAALEAELARRAETQGRVAAAVEAVRDELRQVREQVDAGRDDAADALREEVAGLEERRRALEALLAERDAELTTTRETLAAAEQLAAGLRARLDDEGARRSAAEQALRTDFEARIRELTGEVAGMRRRLEATTSDLQERLDDERRRREAAEAALAERQGASPAAAGDAPTGDTALDELLGGLRDQVDAAREQLEAWDAEPGEPAAPAPAPAAPPDERTRERLQAIEADIRAAVPEEGESVPAREVIASLQRAADRLRAAAEDELAMADGDDAGDAGDAGDREPAAGPIEIRPAAAPAAEPAAAAAPAGGPRVDLVSAGATPAAPAIAGLPLGPRAVDFGAREAPWLRTAIERLSRTDPDRAAQLFLALLPAQATLGGGFSYLLTAPTLGAVRVDLAGDDVAVDPRPDSPSADVRLSGSLETLAPVAAGGAGWRLRGVRVEGRRSHARRLTRARRRPLGLDDLALTPATRDPGTLLTALAAAVDPAWTAGHRFGVSYVVAGTGRWTVIAENGHGLRVADNGGDHPHAAIVHLPGEALPALLQGAPLPARHQATLTGDRRAVDVLHAWFDRARGVGGR